MRTKLMLLPLLLALVASSCWKNEPPASRISFAVDTTTLAAAPVFVAEKKGFWKDEKLEVDIKPFASGRLALDALVARAVDSATVADFPVVLAAFQQHRVRIVGTFSDSDRHVNLLARKDRGISGPQDLKGKRVAFSQGTASEFVMDMFLQQYRLSRTDVKTVALNPPDTVTAIVRGDVDAIFAWQPNIYNAQKQLADKAIVFPSESIYSQPFSVVVREDYLNNGEPELIKLLNGLKKATQFMKQNRAESIEIVSNKIGVDAKDLALIWDGYSFEVGLDPSLTSAMEKEGDWARNAGIVAKDAPVPDYKSLVVQKILAHTND